MTSEEAPVNGLEQFKQLVLPLGEAYIHSGLSYHAIRDGTYLRILHARLFLQSRPTGIPQKVVCFQDQEVGYLPLTDFGFGILEIVERCYRGEQLETPHGLLIFPVGPNTTAQSHFQPLHQIGLPSKRLTVLTLTGAQYLRPRFSAELDWNLKANNPPYDALGELLFEFRLGGYNGDFACLEIPVAHIVEVDFGSRVSGQIAEPGVILPAGVDRSCLSLGIVVHHQGAAIQRLMLFGDQITWSEPETASISADQRGCGKVEIPTGAAIKCFAVYKGIVQHEGWIGDPGSFPNWRRAAYEWADHECEALRDFLFEERRGRKESRDFEVGVASLLWMLGFGVLQLRTGRLQDNPDLFLTTPSGRMVSGDSQN